MKHNKGFVWRWSDILSNVETDKIIQKQAINGINYYSHQCRCTRYYLRFPYEHVYLTPRELQTAQQLMQCKTMRQAADALRLSHRTIEFYLKSIKKKLGCYKKKMLLQILRELIDC
ncbi:MAG: LuxR C-terminal-related transcriptional regulator [Gammaproteobacteria bacterium]|nr:LuxR C-terminal-related transcriptional regulator [Gammaproteobacteria bacterium]MCH9743398.1 LuxR C-terminal-related transcriptional regulator [Gammaproteobacteria bacterium]